MYMCIIAYSYKKYLSSFADPIWFSFALGVSELVSCTGHVLLCPQIKISCAYMYSVYMYMFLTLFLHVYMSERKHVQINVNNCMYTCSWKSHVHVASLDILQHHYFNGMRYDMYMFQ